MRLSIVLVSLLSVLAASCTRSRTGVSGASGALPDVAAERFSPGRRVLLDAHNAYPESGRFGDRIDRALATGVPLAIEQDLYWRRDPRTGRHEVVVAHDSDALAGAPTLEQHFFERIAPIMEQALRDGSPTDSIARAVARRDWPLITLNLDFKTNEPALHDAVWALLGRYERWLTTARRGADGAVVSPLTVGPLLVLTGQDPQQRVRFHDAVGVGESLRLFGAAPVATPVGVTREARARAQVRLSPSRVMPGRANNYQRWVNFAWLAVEEGGAAKAADWTAADSARLHRLVTHAHERGYWIRFYTLDGFSASQDQGYTASYNFGSIAGAAQRWRAVLAAGVDFVATDQYESFHDAVRDSRR